MHFHRRIIQGACLAGVAVLLCQCQGGGSFAKKSDTYDCPAYRPKTPSKVSVKVSLSEQMVYVMEGDRPLLITATCAGTAANPTPVGSFRVTCKIARKRSGSYGFDVRGGMIYPAKSEDVRGKYIGHPMPFWVEFRPGYGFHDGPVWNYPRSHGCLRLHRNVAPKFYALVREGTPVNIAKTQPLDATLGRTHKRPGPEHFAADDPPPAVCISNAMFTATAGRPIFAD